VHDFLHKPLKVFVVCLIVAASSLLLQGNLIQLWGLRRDYRDLNQKIHRLNEKSHLLDMKIERVTDPNFLEFEARDQFDFVEKGDLVFVFTESD